MSAPDTFTRHRATADRLIARYGGAATLVQAGTPPDPVTGLGGTGPTRKPITYIETGYQVGLHADTLVQVGDKLGVMAVPAGMIPTTADKIDFGRGSQSIKDIRPVQPSADAAVLQYAFHAKG